MPGSGTDGELPHLDLSRRTSRELRTIAQALDALSAGQLPALADILMQRFKALEMSIVDAGWGLAKRVELLPDAPAGLTSLSERRAAARSELLHLRLAEARTKAEGATSSRPRSG